MLVDNQQIYIWLDALHKVEFARNNMAHAIHVWYIYIHEWLIFYGINAGKYTSPMDAMGGENQ